MKTYVLLAEGETADEYLRELANRGVEIESVAKDSSQETELRAMYDVTQRPAVLVVQDDGSYVQLWQGDLPSVSDVTYAVRGR